MIGETSEQSLQKLQEDGNMEMMQCLYLLTNLDSPHALHWAVNFPGRGEKLGNVGCTYYLLPILKYYILYQRVI